MNLTFLDSLGYKFIGYIVIACGSVLIIISLVGFFGAWKEKKVLLAIFIIFSILIGFLLIALGAVLIYARQMSDDYLKTEQDCIDNFESADEGCTYAGNAMCHLYCPCKAANAYIETLRENYKNETIEKQIYAYEDIGAETIVDCDPCIEADKYKDEASEAISESDYNNLVEWVQENLNMNISEDCSVTTSEYKDKYFTSDMRKYFPLLRWVEKSFDCSGLCTPQEVYLFSDADNGEPDGSCRQELNDWVQENFVTFGVISIIFGAYMVLVVFFSCTICCCSKKKTDEKKEKKEKDYRKEKDEKKEKDELKEKDKINSEDSLDSESRTTRKKLNK